MKMCLQLFFIVCFSHTVAQEPVFLPEKLATYSVNALHEKVFLHLDRYAYIAGEVCWFKVYNVDATLHEPLELNKVAYIEIINNKNIPVLQTKIALEEGVGNGSLNLPVSMPTGYYTVRAYTNWMKNFSPHFFFERPVLVVNTLKLPDSTPTVPDQKATVRFFPEGGELVAGINSKVAFRMAGMDDRGLDCSGILLNNQNDTVAAIQSLKFGIGTFQFTPVKGFSYRAIVKSNDGLHSISQELPSCHDRGFVMSLDPLPDRLIVKVHAAGNEEQQATVTLLVHARQAGKMFSSTTISNGLATFSIKLSELPDGISHFTVFHKLKPVAERLYCKKPAGKDSIQIAADKNVYGERDKVTLSIASLTGQQAPEANMSLSVFRMDVLQQSDMEDFRTWLLFSSELRGRIDSANYYFSNNGPSVDEALDNIMLTHGWSRFRWEDILDEQPEKFRFVHELSGHIINGKITDVSNKGSQGGIVVYLAVPSQNIKLNGSASTEKGEFNFITRDFFGHNEIIVQAPSGNMLPFRIDISSPFSEKEVSRKLPLLTLSSSHEEALKKASIGMQVQQTFHDQTNRRFIMPLADTSAFYGIPDQSYLLDDYTRFTTIEEVLREYVPQVNVRKQNGKFKLQMYDHENRMLNYDPLVLLDGVPMFDVNRFMSIDPLKLKRLDVIANTYFLGAIRAEGIASFVSYEGDMAAFEPDAGSLVLDYEGLQLDREFYSPDYAVPELLKSRVPDFRNTLYWEPQLLTDEQGQIKVNFYTSDQSGDYFIIVHGLTRDGKALTGKSSFTVTSNRK